MKPQYKQLLLILLLSINMSACKKFVDISPSPQLIATDAIFSDDNTALSAVSGVYVQMRSGSPSFVNGGIGIYAGLTADEIYDTSSSSTYDPYYNNNILSNDGNISDFWSTAYNTIYRTNAILQGLDKSNGLTSPVKNQLKGEMKVVRALIYFYLVNLYGDVPLITTPDYAQNATAERTPVSQVYQQMVVDLTDAQGLLTNTYPSTGKLRPNRLTANALLARIYLFKKDWANAEVQSSAVINSNLYSVLPDLNAVFLINSGETIWEIAPANDAANSAEASAFVPESPTVEPTFAINSYLLNLFDANDKRKTNWLGSNTIGGTTYYYPNKFKNSSTTSITEYNVVFRFAEQYLIRAEARAQQNTNLPGAVNDLNMIHTRAGLSAYPTSLLQADCLLAVQKERRLELFTEWGDRWFDLKRWGTIDGVLGAEKPGWKPYAALFPLPLDQLTYNVKLIQNTGY